MNRSYNWVRSAFVIVTLCGLAACDTGDPTASGVNAANPVITLVGSDPITIEVGTTFTDPGATVTDDVDTGLTVAVAGTVDQAVPGSYILTYDATDSDGNVALTVTRTVNVVDTTAPVITLTGPDPLVLNVSATFVDPGYTVTDNVDTGLTATVTGNVLTGVPGSYVLTYNAADTAGNSANPVARTVQVVDTTAPVISLLGANPLILEGGYSLTDPGVTVTDNVDTGLTASVTGSVNTAVLGTYTLVYNAVDSSSNAALPVSRTVTVVDTTSPVIILAGSNPMTVEGGSAFTDPGATATDNVETGLIVSVSGTVDTAKIGTYTLTYTASDSSTNAATPVTRTVNVVDTSAPVITLSGTDPMNVKGGTVFTDPGSTVSDNIDTGLTATVTGTVDTATVGSYVLTYNATDTAGNAATPVTRTVNVTDITAPVITLSGTDPMTVEGGSIFTDPGSTVSDNIDTGLTATVTGTVDTATVGSYVLTYNATDTAGNAAVAVTRTVIVVDTTAPEILLIGSNPLPVEGGSTFTDPGSNVADNIDASLVATVTGTVDTTTVGTYTLTYNVTDTASNAAIAVTRTVNVVDTTAPLIALSGADPMTLEVGSVFTDPGSTVSDNIDTGLIATVTGTVGTATVGSYVLTYNVTDTASNAAIAVTRTVNIVDTTAPVITLSGTDPMTVEGGSVFTDPGSTVSDNIDTGLTATVTGTVDTATVGSYVLTFNVTDASSNAAIAVTRTVNVVDTTAPVITLSGTDPMTVEGGSVFTDPGSTVTDNIDTGLTATVTGTVDTATVGGSVLTYNVTDTFSNAAIAVTRTVDVVDTTAPVITLNGGNPIDVGLNAVFIDPGLTITDNIDVGLTATVTGTVDTAKLGSNVLTYNVTDAASNAATSVTRIVNVVDITAPVITLSGANPITLEGGSTLTDPGATVTDNVDTGLTASVSGTVNTVVVGAYILTYNATDTAGNAATQVTRTVNVVDTTAPVITLLGTDPMTVEGGSTFTDPGVTITDNVAGVLTVTVTGTVNTAVVGAYVLTYSVSDPSGNAATSVTRTVEVVDTTAPVITLVGANPLKVNVNAVFTDPGATVTDNVDVGLTTTVTGMVNTSVQGASYTLTYDVSDSSGNAATSIMRTVDIVLLSPTAALVVAMKQLQFSWSAVSGADHYRILENPDGISGFTVIPTASNILTTDHTLIIPVHKTDWLSAQYIVEACDAAEIYCSSSLNQSLAPIDSVAAIGYFKASNTGQRDQFGYVVVLSGDGNTLAVGAPIEYSAATGINNAAGETDNSAAGAGAVYVFTRSGALWTQQAYVKASNTDANDRFGYTISLSDDGNTMAVGAYLEGSAATGVNNIFPGQANNAMAEAGAVYVFTRASTTWTQQAYIKASNTEAGDRFGSIVALNADGNTLAVGVPLEDSAATGIGGNEFDNMGGFTGAVYVFLRSAGSWTQQAYIKASNTGTMDYFGYTISLSDDGNTLVAGAWAEDSDAIGIGGDQLNNGSMDSGSVYVFLRTGSSWAQQAYIKASNSDQGDHFGGAVEISGDGTTMVASSVWEDSAATGVGGDELDNSIVDPGAAYVFVRSGSTWTQQAYVKASNPGGNIYFGMKVALTSDGNTMALSSFMERSTAIGVGGSQFDSGLGLAGATYLFARTGSIWAQEAYIKASNTDAGDKFGASVSLSNDGDTMAVGANMEDSSATGVNGVQYNNAITDAGAVYLY